MDTFKKALRASQGLDSALNPVINMADPRSGELLDGVNQGYFIEKNSVQEYDPTRTYDEGFIVQYEGRLYIASSDITTPESFNPDHWTSNRTDAQWLDLNHTTNNVLSSGEHAHLNTQGSSFGVSLPSNPVPGDSVVLHDKTGLVYLRPVTVDGNGKLIGTESSYTISIPESTVYFYYTTTGNWVTTVDYKPKVSLISSSTTSETSPYRLASQERAFGKTSSSKTWLMLPEFPNDGDQVTLYDIDEKNSINYTQLTVSNPAHSIRTFGGTLQTIESNLLGEISLFFDAAQQQWITYASDIRPRVRQVYSSITAEPFNRLLISHEDQDSITVTLPVRPYDANWVEVLDTLSSATSTVRVIVHQDAIANGTKIVGDGSTYLKQKYSDLPADQDSIPRVTEYTFPAGNQGFQACFAFNTSTNEWFVAAQDYRIDVVDEANPGRPGIIALATQAEVDAQNYAPDSETDTVVPDKAVTPETLDGRRASEVLAGLVRVATAAETQLPTTGNHRDDIAVTPKKLNDRTATETRRGVAEIATQTETRSTTNDTHIITPKKFHAAQAEEGLSGVVQLVSTSGNSATSRAGVGTGVFDSTDHLKALTPETLSEYVATETQRGTLWIATQSEANTNTELNPSDTAIITPKKLAARTATESRRGLGRLATSAESLATSGSGEAWDSTFITPQTLNNRTSTESRRGVAEIATQTEVNSGSDNTRIVTPLKLKTWLSGTRVTVVEDSGLTIDGDIWSGIELDIQDASETQRGTLQIATQTEANAQSSALDDVAITPAKLNARRANTGLYGIIRTATTTEVDAAATTVLDAAVTPALLTRWTRTSPNSRSTTTRYGTLKNATAAESWVGNTTDGSTKDYTQYSNNGVAVSPLALNYALQNYLPLDAKAFDSNLLDGLNSTQFARSDTSDVINGVYTFNDNEIHIKGPNPRVGFIDETDVSSTRELYYQAGDIGFTDGDNIWQFKVASNGNTNVYGNIEVDGTGVFGSSIKENEASANGNSPGSGTLRTKYLGINNNAVSASKLNTARTITLTGDLTGSFVFDGSGNVSTSIQVNNNSHAHSGENITSGTVSNDRLKKSSRDDSGIVRVTNDLRTIDPTDSSDPHLALSAGAGKALSERIDQFTPDGGVGESVAYRDYIQIGSVRLATNDQGVLEFTYGHAI